MDKSKLTNQNIRNGFSYFSNNECEFYPCHNLENMNCLFCYCPLYSERYCGGNYTILKSGIKDCSNCVYPHIPENYELIIERLDEISERKRREALHYPFSNDIE